MATSFKRTYASRLLLPGLLQSVPWPCGRPLSTHASGGDSWTPAGKSCSVSWGVTALFSWVLVHTRLCLCPLRVCFPVLCKFWQLYDGVNGNLLQEGLFHTQVYCTQSPCPCNRPLLTHTPQETLKHSSEKSPQQDSRCWSGGCRVLERLWGHTPYPRAKEKPQKNNRNGEIMFRIKHHTS